MLTTSINFIFTLSASPQSFNVSTSLRGILLADNWLYIHTLLCGKQIIGCIKLATLMTKRQFYKGRIRRTWWLNKICPAVRSSWKTALILVGENLSLHQPRLISVSILMNEMLGFLSMNWKEISYRYLVRLANPPVRTRTLNPLPCLTHYVMNNTKLQKQ